MKNRRNYYRILHVQHDAPLEIIKSSYRALMLTLEMHPDRGGDHWNASLINEAYAVLSKPDARAAYDRKLAQAKQDQKQQGMQDDQGSRPNPEATGSAADGASVEPGACCVFCGTPEPESRDKRRCSACRSPLEPPAAIDWNASGRRHVQRMAKQGRIDLFVDWPVPSPMPAELKDLSPSGISFEVIQPIQRDRIVKIEGALLDAVVRVAHCKAVAGSAFAIGAEFFTVRFRELQGTFLSVRA